MSDPKNARIFAGCVMEKSAVVKNWIAVASAEHVRIGRAQGFMQVNHGKVGPLRRIRPGDRVVYYSPNDKFQAKDRYQSFSAVGVVEQGEPYQADMGAGLVAFRRNVRWSVALEVPIAPLLEQLEFSAGKRNWGYQMRFGLFQISDHDMQIIVRSMSA
jgi:EVE domain